MKEIFVYLADLTRLMFLIVQGIMDGIAFANNSWKTLCIKKVSISFQELKEKSGQLSLHQKCLNNDNEQ